MDRVVEVVSKRPQVQERMTEDIANYLVEELDAKGVAVVIEASHSCMTIRGVRKPGSECVTSAMKGVFRESTFAWHTWAWALLQSQQGKGKAYVYYFDHRTSQSPEGAGHGSEILFVFGNLGADPELPVTNQPPKRCFSGSL